LPLKKKCELEVLMLLNLYCLTRLQQSMRHQQIPFAFSETTRVAFIGALWIDRILLCIE
jgi:hypothetical protein